jgi:redox-sensing transcriptional repressor
MTKDIKDLKETVNELNIEIGVITTPPSVAQGVADIFSESQVNAILNFSPTQIHVPDTCLVENIDFTIKLDILTYKLKNEI